VDGGPFLFREVERLVAYQSVESKSVVSRQIEQDARLNPFGLVRLECLPQTAVDFNLDCVFVLFHRVFYRTISFMWS
jgi:hypothetical protein